MEIWTIFYSGNKFNDLPSLRLVRAKSREVIIRLWCASESSRRLIKTQIYGITPRIYDSEKHMSNKFPGDAEAIGW